MQVKLEQGAYKPIRVYETDAGLDLRSREEKIVPARGSAVFDTGVHIQLPWFYHLSTNGLNATGMEALPTVGLITSKSGLYFNHDITSEGTIDMDYTGSIMIKLCNHGDTDYLVREGDKISQLVILPILTPRLEFVDELIKTSRGDSGLGSTGR